MRLSFFSIRAAHDAHVIPPMSSETTSATGVASTVGTVVTSVPTVAAGVGCHVRRPWHVVVGRATAGIDRTDHVTDGRADAEPGRDDRREHDEPDGGPHGRTS